ncbi:ribosome recycling factor [Candidatus Dojkabacteria bacterium]|nr:ribosome recycling factor [Candidatus Dojkabacteria bacterium]
MAKIGLDQLKSEFSEVLEHLNIELGKLRSGRASTDLVSSIKVEAYGQDMPLEQVANINVADPTLLTVQPWDKTIIQAVESAIRKSDAGLNPVVDGDLIRIALPPLTEERRLEYVKILKQRVEEARIRVRQIRQDVKSNIEETEKQGDMSEEDMERQLNQLQEKVDEINGQIEKISIEKEKDLMTV